MSDKLDRTYIITLSLTSVALFTILIVFGLAANYDTRGNDLPDEHTQAAPVSPYRMHYSYEWSDEDIQGDWSENVAAASILLKANNIDIDKETLATWLDKYIAPENTAISVAEYLNHVVPVTDVAVPIAFDYIQFLPAPSIVWLNDGLETRPVVFLCADEAEVEVADPREGIRTYGFTELSKMYEGALRQAVCIADRGYTALSG